MKMIPLMFRAGSFVMVRKVPKRYAAVEPRKQIWLSLGTDVHVEAVTKATAAWDALIASWELRLAGESDEAMKRYDAVREIAARKNITYIPQSEVRQLSTEAIVARVEAISETSNTPNRQEGAAMLGTTDKPKLTISSALEEFWKLAKGDYLGLSEQQARKKKNPVLQSNRDFIDAVGDISLDELKRDHLHDFRDWWLEKMEAGSLSASTVNKNIDHFRKVIRLVNDEKRLGLDPSLLTIRRLNEGEKNTRPPFSVSWIKEKLLADGAFDGLDTEAAAIVKLMINTGARPSELRALTSKTIVLDHSVPHISIESEGRKLKTYNSKRKIPLVGVSLDAAKAFPNGFETHRNGDYFTKVVNEHFARKGLKETDKHTLYSLRHSFEDRMKAADIDHEARLGLMGHRDSTPEYGSGETLERLQKMLLKIAL